MAGETGNALLFKLATDRVESGRMASEAFGTASLYQPGLLKDRVAERPRVRATFPLSVCRLVATAAFGDIYVLSAVLRLKRRHGRERQEKGTTDSNDTFPDPMFHRAFPRL